MLSSNKSVNKESPYSSNGCVNTNFLEKEKKDFEVNLDSPLATTGEYPFFSKYSIFDFSSLYRLIDKIISSISSIFLLLEKISSIV